MESRVWPPRCGAAAVGLSGVSSGRASRQEQNREFENESVAHPNEALARAVALPSSGGDGCVPSCVVDSGRSRILGMAQRSGNAKRSGSERKKSARPRGAPTARGLLDAQLRRLLKATPDADLRTVLDGLNRWVSEGHQLAGRALWTQPLGARYVAALVRDLPGRDVRPALREEATAVAFGRRDIAPKKPVTAATPKQPKPKKPTKPKRTQPKVKRPAPKIPTAEDAAKDAARVARAVRWIVEFMTAAGVQCSVSESGIALAGKHIPLARTDTRSTRAIDAWIDAAISLRCPELLRSAVTAHLDVEGIRLRAEDRRLAIIVDNRPLAVVRATSAKVEGLAARRGNYLAAGTHWNELQADIATARRPSTTVQAQNVRSHAAVTANVRRYSTFPSTVVDPLLTLVMNASSALRTERSLVFGHAVELRYAAGTLRFAPLEAHGTSVRCPFTWAHNGARLDGRLVLTSLRDPVLLETADQLPDTELAQAWTSALLAYADLTCNPRTAPAASEPLSRPSPTGRAHATSPRSIADRTVATAGQLASTALTPVGRTTDWIASYVAGHRRRLRPGQQASREARQRARQVGIALSPGETWVSPHVRGVPPDAVLVFRWSPPEALIR